MHDECKGAEHCARGYADEKFRLRLRPRYWIKQEPCGSNNETSKNSNKEDTIAHSLIAPRQGFLLSNEGY